MQHVSLDTDGRIPRDRVEMCRQDNPRTTSPCEEVVALGAADELTLYREARLTKGALGHDERGALLARRGRRLDEGNCERFE
jgi:hypothetical protein